MVIAAPIKDFSNPRFCDPEAQTLIRIRAQTPKNLVPKNERGVYHPAGYGDLIPQIVA